MIAVCDYGRSSRRRGITLTEILIAILIMGVGLVSLATLFPIGLLRLRDAARYSRSGFLAQSAAADLSLAVAARRPTRSPPTDLLQLRPRLPAMVQPVRAGHARTVATGQPDSSRHSPCLRRRSARAVGLVQRPGRLDRQQPSSSRNHISRDQWPRAAVRLRPALALSDRHLSPPATLVTKADIRRRPASTPGSASSSAIRRRAFPSAHGLQRLTNFNRPYVLMRIARCRSCRPRSRAQHFVSPEDVVWQEPTNQQLHMGVADRNRNTPPVGSAPSPVIPDLSISVDATATDLQRSTTAITPGCSPAS